MLKRLLKMPSSPSLRRLTTAVMVVAVMAVSASAAMATTVNFTTAASFNGGAYGAPLVLTDITLSFQTVTVVGLNAPSQTSLGEFVVTCNNQTTTCNSDSIQNTTFNILITQTVPSAGTGTITSTLAGSIGGNSSAIGTQINFTTTSVTIGGIQYLILQNPLSLVPPASNNGHTSIQAAISPVPEPASMLLLGTGLLGFASSVRRRFVRR